MADYLIARKDPDHDLHHVTIVTADSLRQAVDQVEMEDGEQITVYRVANVRKVRVVEKTVRSMEVE